MTDTDIRLFIGNRMSNLYITIDRLMRNDFPRGVFNEYREAVMDITELEGHASDTQFLSIYVEDLKRQVNIFRDTELATVVKAIAQQGTPTLLCAWCQSLLINNLPSFIREERTYIGELLSGRSRKKTKFDYLEKTSQNLSLAMEVLVNNSLSSEDMLFQDMELLKKDVIEWKSMCE